MAERNQSQTFNLRGMLPRRGVVTGAVQKVRDEVTATALTKSVSIGAAVGLGIAAVKGALTGDFSIGNIFDPIFVGGGATVGVAHAVAHSLIENAADGVHEAIQHNRACDQIENALCQNPELLQQAAADRAAAYQFDHQPTPNATAQNIIAETEQRRASGMNTSLAAQAPSAPGSRVL